MGDVVWCTVFPQRLAQIDRGIRILPPITKVLKRLAGDVRASSCVAYRMEQSLQHASKHALFTFINSTPSVRRYLRNGGLIVTHKIVEFNFKDARQLNKFREIQTTFATLVFRDETLWLAQSLRDINLR